MIAPYLCFDLWFSFYGSRPEDRCANLKEEAMRMPIRYHQMLVSPHLGGGEKIAIGIHEHIVANRGPTSQLMLPGGGEVEQSAKQAGVPFVNYRIDHLTGPSLIMTILENLKLYAKTLRHGTGIVHVHSPFVYGAARLFFSASRLKTVLHIHLDYSSEQLKWPLRRFPDLIISCAGFMKKAIDQAIGEGRSDRTRIKIIENAIDLKRFGSAEPRTAKIRLGIYDDIPLLMMIANLAPHKGQETAIRTVAELKKRGLTAKLWLVGSERSDVQGYLRNMRELCKHLSVDNQVDFVGFRNDVPELLAAADFLLLPSRSEGLPLVILEAQAAKAIVLASPTAGIPEVIKNGRTGFLIDAIDHKAYAERIAQLLDNPYETKKIMDVAYRYVCDHHDIEAYGSRILQAYDELLPAR